MPCRKQDKFLQKADSQKTPSWQTLHFDESFASGTSFLHHRDPRVRLAAALLSSICIALLQHLESAGMALAAGILLLLSGHPAMPFWAKRLGAMNLFLLFLWLTVPFSVKGNILAQWHFLQVTDEGILLALLVTLKSNAIACFFLALVTSMETPVAGHAMEKLHVPVKIVFLFFCTWRFMHVLAAEWERLHNAAILRGFRMRTDMHTYRTAGNMLGMLFIRSEERASRVYEAMLLRGFTGHFQTVTVFRTSWRDYLFLVLIIVVIAILILLDLHPAYLHWLLQKIMEILPYA